MESRAPLTAAPWPRVLSVMLGLAIVALVFILLLALAQWSHRTRAQDKPALVVPAPAETAPAPVVPAPAETAPAPVVPAPAETAPALVVPAPTEGPPVDPLFDVDRIERLLKRGEKPTR